MTINRYNSMVMGVHNYFCHATGCASDLGKIAWKMDKFINNRLNAKRGGVSLSKTGDARGYIRIRYGNSKAIRYCNGNPLVPVSYITHKPPKYKKACICSYTPEGRAEIHKTLGVNMDILHRLMRSRIKFSSIEFMDNRISLYAAQYGRCAVTGKVLDYDDIHCHHIVPLQLGGTDKYQNLKIVHAEIHKLIHASQTDTISRYLQKFNLNKAMLEKLNNLREKLQLERII